MGNVYYSCRRAVQIPRTKAARQKVLSVCVQLKVIWLRVGLQPADKRDKLNENNNETKRKKKM